MSFSHKKNANKGLNELSPHIYYYSKNENNYERPALLSSASGSKGNRRGTGENSKHGRGQAQREWDSSQNPETPEALLFKSPKPEANKMSLDGKFPDRKNYTFKTISWWVRLAGFVYRGEKSKVNENIYQSNLSPNKANENKPQFWLKPQPNYRRRTWSDFTLGSHGT